VVQVLYDVLQVLCELQMLCDFIARRGVTAEHCFRVFFFLVRPDKR
jgi:hypothetical protein